jgi:regulatory protein YycI of two-component signal transduction system YycFG
MENKQKTSPIYWVVFVIVFVFAFISTYELFSGKSISSLFESKSEKCKQEAQDRARSLRDKELEGLKLKENPTPQDLQEIERLEIQQKTSILDKEDYEYAYENCMR